jgi:hypothetical protein
VDHGRHLAADRGLFLVGYLYDYWTLNAQIEAVNAEQRSGRA